MSQKRIGLAGLRVEGPSVAPASIDFATGGLTVISGASDTGKTYIANTIDFLLGAATPPPENPTSRAYTRAILEITADGKSYCISRNFRENAVFLFEGPMADLQAESSQRQVSAFHRPGSDDTLSHFLLALIGLEGKQIRKNQYLEKASLTIRHLSHLTVIFEERIISKLSPAVNENPVSAPLERSIFSFFLTGIDDAELTAVEKPKDRKARLDTEETLIQSLLDPKEAQFQKLTGNDPDVPSRLEKIDTAIGQATELISSTRQEIDELERVRKENWESLQRHKSRHLFVTEQVKRFLLLADFYQSDQQRLESVLEAGKTFESLPGGECAVCGSLPSTSPLATTVVEFNTACLRELEKINQLASELSKAIEDTKAEESKLIAETERLDDAVTEDEKRIRQILEPRSDRADTGLSELFTLRNELTKAAYLADEIKDLRQRLTNIETARKGKGTKTSTAAAVGVAQAARFCEVVQNTLKAWSYPIHGNVSFDPDQKKFDLVVGDQDRGTMGKGYRAITHAAFVIGLMRYCRQEGIPHPGFVVLDTPLNPFKGPDEGSTGTVNDQIKDAFFEDLANDKSGDQFIILENIDPPPKVIPFIRYHHFTKNPTTGRYGFFPVRSNTVPVS